MSTKYFFAQFSKSCLWATSLAFNAANFLGLDWNFIGHEMMASTYPSLVPCSRYIHASLNFPVLVLLSSNLAYSSYYREEFFLPHTQCIWPAIYFATAGSVVLPSVESLLYLLWVEHHRSIWERVLRPQPNTFALIFRPRHAEVLNLIQQRTGSVHRVKANPYRTWSSSVAELVWLPPVCGCEQRGT